MQINDADPDLNLMLVFDALMRERSVTRAAARLGIGQPAASSALARLRALFRDELFIRDGRVMVPTARSLALAQPIGSALAALRDAIAPTEAFQPETATRRFRISAGDYAVMILLPALAARLRQAAPGIDLRLRFVEKDRIPELLEQGELDLAIGVFPDAPKRFVCRTLLGEEFVCIARADHPALQQTLTLEGYVALPHVLVTERGDETGAVDAALRPHGLRRRIALTLPQLLLLPRILPDSDLIATVGRRAAAIIGTIVPLTCQAPPVTLEPWQLTLLLSRKVANDPALDWLVRLLHEIACDL